MIVKNKVTDKMKLRALKFMLLGKEIKFEISYSNRYLKKIKELLNNKNKQL